MKKPTKIIGNIIFIIFIPIIIFLLFTTLQATISGEEPSLFGHKLYYVYSGSMSPTLPVGSLIVVQETSFESIQNQDIITYRDADTFVTHRVVDISDSTGEFITQGDANEIDDPFPIEESRLVGKMVTHIPYIGYLLNFLKSKYGVLALSATLILILYLSFLSKKEKQLKSIE